ncbi:cobyrinate a,c-diamide synthase [Plantactinospora siamensis]|uniref:Cobyrinate a,c-diamide synthase n=1 Tax=Plantactinospora siamensis TaxID=555372 RepID=A0ABV6NY15_9ACTN
MTAVPRLVVSAPSSGHGKTAITVGLLAAWAARGLDAAGFKIGPDRTDAAYLGLAAGRPGRTLDARLIGPQRVAPLFAFGAASAGIAVVEGTMGLYDSLSGRPDADSTAAVATALRAPVVLVVDVAAMGQSVAALVHGFRAYDELLWLGGVILNRVASDRHEELLREALDDLGVPVFGALRRHDLPSVLPSRQHGVVPVLRGSAEAAQGVRRLGEAVAATVDLDGMLRLASSAPRLSVDPWSVADAAAGPTVDQVTLGPRQRPVVAVAGGSAGSYSHPETAELLAAAGADVVTVDPLRDEGLPAGTSALVIGGGLPETYAPELSANRRLCIAVAELARTGHPVVAEGTGLLWLLRQFDGQPMCGVLDAEGGSMDSIVVGYRDATARSASVVAGVDDRVVGYKQHRGVVHPRSGEAAAWRWAGTDEGFVWRGVHASQLTLHWAGVPGLAGRLVTAAAPAQPAGPAPRTGRPAVVPRAVVDPPAATTPGVPAQTDPMSPAGPGAGFPAAPEAGGGFPGYGAAVAPAGETVAPAGEVAVTPAGLGPDPAQSSRMGVDPVSPAVTLPSPGGGSAATPADDERPA